MIKNRTYTVLLLFLFTLGLKAQEVQGPYFVYYLLKNTSLSKTYDGFCQKNKVIEDSTAHGAFILGGPKCQPTVNYAPAAGFVGRDTATYEYKEYYTNKIKYWSFVYLVVNSHVELRPDIYSVDMNAADQDINPLTNDSCSIGTYQFLKIKTISAANQLVVSQPSDTTIRFRPETNFTGLAYISYTVCDTFNTCKDGNITINVVDQANLHSDSMSVGTPKNTPVTIPLPQSGYSTSINPKKGYLEYNTDYSVIYKPASGLFGKDTFAVVKNNIYRYVFVEIYNLKDPSKITVDDIVFTPKDSIVLFNVGDNDIVQKYAFLLDQGPNKGVLTKLNNQGDFSYEPEVDYEGVQSFTYKVCPQGICEYGEVRIFIGNWEPDTRADYKFTTHKNLPIVISYHIPIDAYNFSSPDTSKVKAYQGLDTIEVKFKIKNTINCTDTVAGYNLLIYYPPKDYIGKDSFIVNYCIPSTGECVEAICDVSIYEVQNYNGKTCEDFCVGDCVWPGDVNLDGEVTIQDFLQIGYSLGKEGTNRSQTIDKFKAIHSSDWGEMLQGSIADIKHADADGNGTVDCADTMYVSDYYRLQHSLVPKPVYDRGDFPMILNVLTPNAGIGDLAQIEIQLGDNKDPVINLGGFAYELDYNTDVVDESSLGIDFYENGWATMNSALMHMYQKPWDGRIESGFIRSNGNKVSGKGGVEVLQFIVEDNLGGFRKGEQLIKVPFYFQNIVVLGDDGRYVQLPDQVAYITIGGKTKEPELNPNALLVYPNPAVDVLNVHLNGQNQLLSMSLFNLDGSLIKEIKNSDKKHQLLNIQNLPNGLYLLKAETTLGPISKKVEVFR